MISYREAKTDARPPETNPSYRIYRELCEMYTAGPDWSQW